MNMKPVSCMSISLETLHVEKLMIAIWAYPNSQTNDCKSTTQAIRDLEEFDFRFQLVPYNDT